MVPFGWCIEQPSTAGGVCPRQGDWSRHILSCSTQLNSQNTSTQQHSSQHTHMAVVLSQPVLVSSAEAAAMPPNTRYTPTPVAPENPISLPVSLSHGVQLREAGGEKMSATAISSNFRDDDAAKRTRRGRRRGGWKQQQATATGVKQRTIKKQPWRKSAVARPRAPPPPPRNTNAYLMAAAAARSKAEHGDTWQETSVLASPGRSCASTCFGGGAVPVL